MRGKSKPFQRDSKTRGTPMVKFSARSGSKNISLNRELSKGSVKFRNNYFVSLSSEDPEEGFVPFGIDSDLLVQL